MSTGSKNYRRGGEQMNATLMWIIQLVIQLGILYLVLWGAYHLARTVIKQSVHEALVEHDKFMKDKPKWEDALKRVEASRRKFQ